MFNRVTDSLKMPIEIQSEVDKIKASVNLDPAKVADFHYAFMGAAPIPLLKPRAQQIAALLKKDGVDAVLLSPV